MSADMIPLLTKALGETVYMVVVSMIIATIIGVPLGVLLHTTSKGQILESLAVNRIVGAIVNAVRSIPFIILLVAIIPFTRLLVGSAIGTTAAMVPLVIAAIPFIGRQVETSLKEVPFGLVEACDAGPDHLEGPAAGIDVLNCRAAHDRHHQPRRRVGHGRCRRRRRPR